MFLTSIPQKQLKFAFYCFFNNPIPSPLTHKKKFRSYYIKTTTLFDCRERYLNFVCSLDLMEEIPQKTVYNLLKQNLGKAEMLTYVFVFNAPGWDEELDFVWGQADKNQWKVRGDININTTVGQTCNWLKSFHQ